MAAGPRVSVVIPVFQRARELAFALHSLASEAELIHEVVVVDDASPEPLVLDMHSALATRTRLIRLTTNLGSSGARQAGVDAATGDLIAFLDSDDAWLPGKLAAQLPLMSGGPLVAAVCGWQAVDIASSRQTTRIPVAGDGPADFASGCWFSPGATALIWKEAFDAVGGLDPALRRLEDLDWFLRFALAGGRIIVAPVVGALVRRAAKQNRALVEDAAARIAARFAEDPRVDARTARHLAAWLDTERAFASLTEGSLLAALGFLARSQIRVPRMGAQLRRWWRIGPPVIPSREAQWLLGLSPAE